MIVLNRGYGVGEYQFDYCLVTPEIIGSASYLVENHLICIKADTAVSGVAGGGGGIMDAGFQRVLRSFRDPRTREFIECYFGNSAINTTELNHMLPIYE